MMVLFPITQEKTISSALTSKNSFVYLSSFPADHKDPVEGQSLRSVAFAAPL